MTVAYIWSKLPIMQIWIVPCFLIVLMQAGFALMETGLCRAKNAAHTMSITFLAYALGITAFWACGYGLMCGGVASKHAAAPWGNLNNLSLLKNLWGVGHHLHRWDFIGGSGFFLAIGRPGHAHDAVIIGFLFMMLYLSVAATIPTGALAERWSFKSFFVFTLLVGAVIFPVYACWRSHGSDSTPRDRSPPATGALARLRSTLPLPQPPARWPPVASCGACMESPTPRSCATACWAHWSQAARDARTLSRGRRFLSARSPASWRRGASCSSNDAASTTPSAPSACMASTACGACSPLVSSPTAPTATAPAASPPTSRASSTAAASPGPLRWARSPSS